MRRSLSIGRPCTGCGRDPLDGVVFHFSQNGRRRSRCAPCITANEVTYRRARGVPVKAAPNPDRPCSRCGKDKSNGARFNPRSDTRNRYSHCKECIREKRRMSIYGLSVDDFDRLMESQGHACAICKTTLGGPVTGKRTKLSIDHCHDTGKVRGILCIVCNTAIGMLGDTLPALQGVVDYLKKTKD